MDFRGSFGVPHAGMAEFVYLSSFLTNFVLFTENFERKRKFLEIGKKKKIGKIGKKKKLE